jgi:tRNA threonylcarbamoyladenosine biosynthesis protein TsaB
MAELSVPGAPNRGVILALDTTTRAGSIALRRRDGTEEVLVGDPARSHGERLPEDIRALLERAGARVADVEVFAVINGPGSFTGLRVGIAAIQGLAMATGRPVVAVPALEALAAAPSVPRGYVGVWMDAQRQQVFAAIYERDEERVREVAVPVSWGPDRVIEQWTADGFRLRSLIGDGVDLHAGRLHASWPDARIISPAPALAPIAAALASRGAYPAVAPHAIVPVYVRPSDAEIARARTEGNPRT